MKKRSVLALLGLILSLAVTGCGAQETGGEQEVSSAESQVAAISEEESTETQPEQQIDYHYGDRIETQDRDSFNVEGLYNVTVNSIFSGYDAVIADITVETAEGEFHHTVHRTEKGYTQITCEPQEIPPYTIEMPESIIGKATLVFAERVYPDPVVLSGDPEEVYTFDDYAYAVNDKFVLYFDKDISVTGDVMVLLEKVYDSLEEKTGLKFRNDSFYSTCADYGTAESYFDYDPWNGYEYYHKDKLGIYFIHDRDNKTWISCSSGNCLVLVDQDFDFHNESLNTAAHEMAHTLDRANHDNFARVLTEGFGSYWGRQVSIEFPEYIVGEYAEYGPDHEYYWSMPELITAKNAETLFNGEFDRMENNSYYQYGFQLMTYLYETYPLEQVNEFYNVLSRKLWDKRLEEDEYAEQTMKLGFLGDHSSEEYETGVIKEFWGEDFFTEFGSWAKKNADRFY